MEVMRERVQTLQAKVMSDVERQRASIMMQAASAGAVVPAAVGGGVNGGVSG